MRRPRSRHPVVHLPAANHGYGYFRRKWHLADISVVVVRSVACADRTTSCDLAATDDHVHRRRAVPARAVPEVRRRRRLRDRPRVWCADVRRLVPTDGCQRRRVGRDAGVADVSPATQTPRVDGETDRHPPTLELDLRRPLLCRRQLDARATRRVTWHAPRDGVERPVLASVTARWQPYPRIGWRRWLVLRLNFKSQINMDTLFIR